MSSLQIIEDRTLAESQALFRTFREAGGHTSFSATNCYLRCPRQFKYKYVTREQPAFVADNLLFGVAMHTTVAGYYSHLKDQGEPLNTEKLLSAWDADFERAIAGARYPVKYGKKSKDELQELGRAMLTVFAGSITPRRIIAVEVPFRLPLHDPRTGAILGLELVGSMDLIEADDAGNLIVSDLKTAAKKWSDAEARQSLQASLYALALSEMLELPEDTEVLVRFDVLTKTKSPSLQHLHTTRGMNDRRRVLGLIRDVLRATEAKVFNINPGWQCSGCEYQGPCEDEVAA